MTHARFFGKFLKRCRGTLVILSHHALRCVRLGDVLFFSSLKKKNQCILCTNLNKVEQVRVMRALQGRGREKERGGGVRQGRRVLDGEEAEGARKRACRAEPREERDRGRERAEPSGSSGESVRRAMSRLNGSRAPRWRSLSEELSVPLALCLSTHHPSVYRVCFVLEISWEAAQKVTSTKGIEFP